VEQLPLWAGLERAVRRTAPAATVMLVALYLASLMLSLSADRAVVKSFEQVETDQAALLSAGP
jgi:hypothetical protein